MVLVVAMITSSVCGGFVCSCAQSARFGMRRRGTAGASRQGLSPSARMRLRRRLFDA
jgi:hypothetical protein